MSIITVTSFAVVLRHSTIAVEVLNFPQFV